MVYVMEGGQVRRVMPTAGAAATPSNIVPVRSVSWPPSQNRDVLRVVPVPQPELSPKPDGKDGGT